MEQGIGDERSMPTRNINLTVRLDEFIQSSVHAGRYQNASEVVREGLRLLEHREQENASRLERLRAAAREGLEALDQGRYVELGQDDLEEHIARLGREATVSVKPTN